ncbi:hypothetical protein GC176_05480 [bacterium]|nr:hypothetical protein [bacterium]
MNAERDFDPQSLTLPDLLVEAERIRKQMTGHLRFDLQPKAQSLAEHRENNAGTVLDSVRFGLELMAQWNRCCDEVVRRIDTILNES